MTLFRNSRSSERTNDDRTRQEHGFVQDESSRDRQLIGRWLVAFILLGLAWRFVRFALAMPVWGDEAMLGLNVISRSYRQLLQPLEMAQAAPFGFTWALRFTFDQFGVSDYTTRLPALVAGSCALLVFWQWAKSLVSARAVTLATAVFAVSMYLVRHGVEMKPYASDLFAAVLLLFLGTRYLLSRRPVWLITLAAVSPLCLALSYPAVFTAAGIGVAILLNSFRENWNRRILAVGYCMVVGASFIVALKISAAAQYETQKGLLEYWAGAFPPANPLKFVVWFVQIHTGNLFAYPLGGKNGASLFPVILFSIGMAAMWPKWQLSVRTMLLAPFLFTFVAAVLRFYPYGESARVSQHLAPVIILGIGAGIEALIEAAATAPKRHARLQFTAVVLFTIGLVALGRDIIWPYKTKEDQRMRSNVRSLLSAANADPIFLLEPELRVTAPLRWYLHERPSAIFYGADPSVVRQGGNSVWTIMCNAPKDLCAALAQQTGMEAKLWLKRDLPPARSEDPPTQFEIIHLVR